MISEQLEAIQQQKNYYRNQLRRLVKVLILFMLLVILLIGIILYKYFTLPQSYYFATSSDSTLTQLLAVPKGTELIERKNTQ